MRLTGGLNPVMNYLTRSVKLMSYIPLKVVQCRRCNVPVIVSLVVLYDVTPPLFMPFLCCPFKVLISLCEIPLVLCNISINVYNYYQETKGVNYHSKHVTCTQQQRPEPPTQTLT